MKGIDWRDSRMTCELFCILDADMRSVNVIDTFKASSYAEAIEYTRKYREEHKSDGWTYYWRTVHSRDFADYGLWHCDGICSWGASDVDNVFIDWIAKVRVKMRNDRDLTNKKSYVRKIAIIRRMSACKVIRGLLWCWLKVWDSLIWYCWRKPKDKFTDWRWDRRNLKNWKKTGHSLDECWSLDMHMLQDLKYNLKKLNENGYTINTKFIYDVLHDKYPTESDEEIERRVNEVVMDANGGRAEKTMKLAEERQRATYDHIAHLVDLYTFYVYGEVDGKPLANEDRTPDMKEHLVECTYDMVDYGKMIDEGQKIWNEIWDLVKKYGQQMGD